MKKKRGIKMASRNVKAWLQVGINKEQKEVFDLIARRSPQQSVSALIAHLVDAEIYRVLQFDKVVQQFVIDKEAEHFEKRTGMPKEWLEYGKVGVAGAPDLSGVPLTPSK